MDVNGVDRLGRTKAGDRAFVRKHIVGACTAMSLRQASTQPIRGQRLSCSAKGGEGFAKLVDRQRRTGKQAKTRAYFEIC
jgi:hypothetical protein